MALVEVCTSGVRSWYFVAGSRRFFSQFFMTDGSPAELARRIQLLDFQLMGLLVSIWTLVLTLTIGSVIVWLMKGPAYVADAYEVSHSNKPKP